MIKEFEASGKTIEEAMDKVSILADRSINEMEIEVIQMPSNGFLGIGRKDAKVKASFEVPDMPGFKKAKNNRESADSQEAHTSTFGSKKSKKEKAEARKEKAKADFDLKPIVSIDPEKGIPDEIRQEAAAAPKAPRAPRSSESGQRYDRRDRSNRSERPERREHRHEENREDARPRRESKAIEVTEGEMAETLMVDVHAFLDPIFNYLQVIPEFNVSVREGILYVAFTGEKLGVLIGRRGETLNALQYLTNLSVNKQRNGHVRIVLDVENYRDGRAETLEALAHKMAEKAVRTGRRVELEPMNPHERRVVHMALQDDKRVDTMSHGEEPYRRVVISKRRDRRYDHRRHYTRDQRPQSEGAETVSPVTDAPVSAPAEEN